eukprot:SAG31_NODE_24084_length_489_cov_1.869231_1_plen_106_part_01
MEQFSSVPYCYSIEIHATALDASQVIPGYAWIRTLRDASAYSITARGYLMGAHDILNCSIYLETKNARARSPTDEVRCIHVANNTAVYTETDYHTRFTYTQYQYRQ